MTVWHQWAQHGRTPAQEAERHLAELQRVAESKKLKDCPGILLDTDDCDLPPTRYRQDATAARAQALFDFHRGVDPEPQPHL